MDVLKSGGFLSPGDFGSELPPAGSSDAVAPAVMPDAARAVLEEVFDDWRSENYDLLLEGLPVDVLDLRLRLNAASAKVCKSARLAPSAS